MNLLLVYLHITWHELRRVVLANGLSRLLRPSARLGRHCNQYSCCAHHLGCNILPKCNVSEVQSVVHSPRRFRRFFFFLRHYVAMQRWWITTGLLSLWQFGPVTRIDTYTSQRVYRFCSARAIFLGGEGGSCENYFEDEHDFLYFQFLLHSVTWEKRCGINICWDNKKSEMANMYLSCKMSNY